MFDHRGLNSDKKGRRAHTEEKGRGDYRKQDGKMSANDTRKVLDGERARRRTG